MLTINTAAKEYTKKTDASKKNKFNSITYVRKFNYHRNTDCVLLSIDYERWL